MVRKLFLMGVALAMAVFATYHLLANLQAAQAAPAAGALILYDGALGGTPDTQNFVYGAVDLGFPFTVEASQAYSDALQATILDTTPDMSDLAGYGVTPTLVPTLNRDAGFQLNFTVQVTAETHTNNDRAGFNVTLLSADLWGIEIAFWEDEIWAQEGGSPPQLFTHAEGVPYDTTTWTDYELEIIEDIYRLSADGVLILTGPVRDYTAWEPPFPLPDPYEQPNAIGLTDNTSSAQAEIRFAHASLMTGTAPIADIVPASLTVSEAAGTAVLDVQLSFTSTLNTTITFTTIDGTAVSGVDYTPVSGTLTFTPGVTSQRVAIPILDNGIDEPDRDFTLSLTDARFAQLGRATATITIADDDGIIVDPPQLIFLPVVLKP